MLLPKTLLVASAAAILAVAPCRAQSETNRVADGGGIALVKPQTWSKEADATVLEFTGFTDRSAVGNAAAGYYEFKLKSGQTRQVPASRAVKVVIFPDLARITDVVTPADREKLAATLTSLQAVVAKFPATKAQLDPSIKAIGGEVAKFDADQVKAAGAWMPRKDYLAAQAREIAAVLQTNAGGPAASASLESDPRFIALQEMGKESPEAKALADKLLTRQKFANRANERKTVLAQLAAQGLTIEAARGLVKQLAGLNPGEDPASRAVFEQWDNADRQLAAAAAIAGPAAADLEKQLSAVTDPVGPPPMADGLVTAASAASAKLEPLRGAGLPSQIESAADAGMAFSRYVTTMKKLPELTAAKSFFEADTALEQAMRDGEAIGPNAARVATALRRPVSAQIEAFVAARGEAGALAAAGKTKEALAKYRAAFAIIPDPAMGAKIAELEAAQPEKK